MNLKSVSTPEEYDKAMRTFMAMDLQELAHNVLTAQFLWQSHRALVETTELPSWLKPFLDYDANDPPIPSDEAIAALALTEEEMQDTIDRARKCAQEWAAKRHKAAAVAASA